MRRVKQVSVFGDDPAKGAGYKGIEVATDTGDGNEVSQPTDLSVSNPEPGHIPPSSMSLGSVTAADNWREVCLSLSVNRRFQGEMDRKQRYACLSPISLSTGASKRIREELNFKAVPEIPISISNSLPPRQDTLLCPGGR